MQPNNESEEQERFLRWAQLTCAGEVAAMVAHDINNAVTGVMSYTELAQMDLPSWSEAGAYLQKSLEQAKRISDLANRLLMLSHEALPAPTRQDVRESLEAVCTLVRRRLEKDRIVFEPRLDITDAYIVADGAHLLLTWLGLILVSRLGLLQMPNASFLGLEIVAERTTRGDAPWARVVIAARADVSPSAQFLEAVGRAGADGVHCRREGMLYAAARAHASALSGEVAFREADGGFAFEVCLPLIG